MFQNTPSLSDFIPVLLQKVPLVFFLSKSLLIYDIALKFVSKHSSLFRCLAVL